MIRKVAARRVPSREAGQVSEPPGPVRVPGRGIREAAACGFATPLGGPRAEDLDLLDERTDSSAESRRPPHGDRVDRPGGLGGHDRSGLGRLRFGQDGRLADHARPLGRPDDALHDLIAALVDLAELGVLGVDAVLRRGAVDQDHEPVLPGLHDLRIVQRPIPIGDVRTTDDDPVGPLRRDHAAGQSFDVEMTGPWYWLTSIRCCVGSEEA